MISQAIILAGGKGSRLGVLTKNTPKPLLKISGKPFIEYLIWNLARQGIEEIIIMTGFMSESFLKNYHNKSFFGSKVKIYNEDQPLGTAGCLVANLDKLDEKFWVINGDSFFDCNLLQTYQLHQDTNGAVIIGTRSQEVQRFGSINYDKKMQINGFSEKNKTLSEGVINSGIYLIQKFLLNDFAEGFLSMEYDVLPKLIIDKNLKLDIQDGYFIDIGVPESFKKANKDFPDIITKPALFLDRDGTLNIDNGYTHKIEDLEFIDGVFSSLIKAINKGFYIILITNQGGIAKGLFTKDDMQKFNKKIIKELRLKGANIDYVYFCEHHPDAIDETQRECACRKPKSGMILQALNELPIKLSGSFMVGDKHSDIKAGESAGVKSLLFDEANLENFLTKHGVI